MRLLILLRCGITFPPSSGKRLEVNTSYCLNIHCPANCTSPFLPRFHHRVGHIIQTKNHFHFFIRKAKRILHQKVTSITLRKAGFRRKTSKKSGNAKSKERHLGASALCYHYYYVLFEVFSFFGALFSASLFSSLFSESRQTHLAVPLRMLQASSSEQQRLII